MQQIQTLQKVIDYIEERIKEEIDPKELANIAGYSPYHFYRLFNKHIGYPIMDYVLRRKLQYAIFELTTDKKIIEIALDYGFQTHAGFTKAFKRCFGCSPSLYKLHCPISHPLKPDLMKLQQKEVGGMILQPKMISKEAFWVAGKTFEVQLGNISYTRDAPAFWEDGGFNDGSIETALYTLLNPKKHGEYCFNINHDIDEKHFMFLFAVEYDQFTELPREMVKQEIPAAIYAVFRTPLVETNQFVSSIKGTWRYILEDWLPHSGYEVDENSYDFEYYDENCHHWEHKKIYMEIHLPVKRRGG
ncbi:helix-turn-helix domain-containing protein [Cytobacillus sp. FJAT-53684]|uniref:Helix-turn-helix domain-containing protein n=1 Tax=Cytobacillus mangrovibacter TaxID=3299024 RepID=A0ABW6K0G1_9BACI